MESESVSCADAPQGKLPLSSVDGTVSDVPSERGSEPSKKRKKEPKYRLKTALIAAQVEQIQHLLGLTLEAFEPIKTKKKLAEDVPRVNPMASFFVFWKIYPRQDIQGAAMREWRKLQPDGDTFKAILDDVKKRSTSWEWQKDGGKWIPYAHTYLSGLRWLDKGVVQGQAPARRSTVV